MGSLNALWVHGISDYAVYDVEDQGENPQYLRYNRDRVKSSLYYMVEDKEIIVAYQNSSAVITCPRKLSHHDRTPWYEDDCVENRWTFCQEYRVAGKNVSSPDTELAVSIKIPPLSQDFFKVMTGVIHLLSAEGKDCKFCDLDIRKKTGYMDNVKMIQVDR
jgi:hypothetical protein